jgi:tetratricopeptide (TPR) repeat protein
MHTHGNNKGFSLYNLGRYDEAIKCFDTAIYLDPSLTIALNNKYAAKQKLDESYQPKSNPIPLYSQPPSNGNNGACKLINTPYGQMLQCAGGNSSGSTGIGAPGMAVT